MRTEWQIGDWAAANEGAVPDADGTRWQVLTHTGWDDSPAVRVVTDDRPRADGWLGGESFKAGRSISLTGLIRATSDGAMLRARQRLAAILSDGRVLTPLVVTRLGVSQFALVRLSSQVEMEFVAPLKCRWRFTLQADDHRKYDFFERSVSTGLPASMGGLSVPVAVPLSIASSGSSGRVSAMNAGTAATSPVITINGPVVNPRVDFVSTGQTLRFTSNLDAGHFLQVDTRRGTVLLDGSVNRANELTNSTPVAAISLPPGQSTEITFRAQSSLGGASVVITWRDAYL